MRQIVYFKHNGMKLPRCLKDRIVDDNCIAANWRDNWSVDDIIGWYSLNGALNDEHGIYSMGLQEAKEVRRLMIEQRDWKSWWRLWWASLLMNCGKIKELFYYMEI